jgi:hypothetical protein
LFFRNTITESPSIIRFRQFAELFLFREPFVAKLRALITGGIDGDTILAVFGVLNSRFLVLETEIRNGVPLREFLEGKRTMTQDLTDDIPRAFDFETYIHHFERGPMPVFDEISDKSVIGFGIVLIAGIRYAGAIGDQFGDGFFATGYRDTLRVAYEFDFHSL